MTGKDVSAFLLLLVIGVVTSAHCKRDIRKLDNFLCQVVKHFFPKADPATDPASYFLERYYSTKYASTDWINIKGDVEKWVGDKFDDYQLKNLDTWHKSTTARINTCVVKTNIDIRRACLRNLQEDLSGDEPKFRGTNGKEKSLYLKYYDIFVVTYLSISEMLVKISDGTLKESVVRDVSVKAKIFQKYLTLALPLAEAHACRFIKIEVERAGLFWWKHVQYWPRDGVYLTADSSKPAQFRGCGVLRKSVQFRSTVVNTAKKTNLGGPWTYDACTEQEGITNTLIRARPTWYRQQSKCGGIVTTELWQNIGVRTDMLKYL